MPPRCSGALHAQSTYVSAQVERIFSKHDADGSEFWDRDQLKKALIDVEKENADKRQIEKQDWSAPARAAERSTGTFGADPAPGRRRRRRDAAATPPRRHAATRLDGAATFREPRRFAHVVALTDEQLEYIVDKSDWEHNGQISKAEALHALTLWGAIARKEAKKKSSMCVVA